MTLDACLPAHLRGPETTISRIAMGFSGAAVYRVEAAGQSFVLKIADLAAPIDAWRRTLRIQELAANASLTPRIVHVDEAQRAIVTAFVADKSFAALYGNPHSRGPALDLAGSTLRRVHQIPAPAGDRRDPRDFLSTIWPAIAGSPTAPSFARDAVRRILTDDPPALDRALVLSHNDVNPTNLLYDGERVLLLDWDAAGLNDPLYDPATLALFYRMDEAACCRLLAAYEGEARSALPARFVYNRRLAGVLCGAGFSMADASGGGGETLETTPSLGEFYRRMRSGEVNLAAAEGRRAFGLSLIKEAVTLE